MARWNVKPLAGREPCRHCKARVRGRPKGLCWACYYAPGVRGLYSSASKHARSGVEDFNGPAKAPEPSCALPGTPEFVAVMEGRASRGEALFSTRDARR